MRLFALAFAISTLLLSRSAFAWSAGDVGALTQAFVSRVSNAYTATQYPWQFLSDCTSPECFGTNPDSVYGAPNFSPGGDNAKTTRMKRTDALVFIMETPPASRYFGVTPYIFTRYYPNAIPLNPLTPGTIPVFESLGDTVNQLVIGTTGSSAPGTNPFTQLSVFIVTADTVTRDELAGQFVGLGLPDHAVNKIALPYNAVPLNMGLTPGSDTYSTLMRIAYPNDPAQLTSYIQRSPIAVVYLSPGVPRALSPLPTPLSRIPGDGNAESNSLASARDLLVGQLRTRFGSAFTITETNPTTAQTNNYVCVTYGLPCNGDNPDAIYTRDANRFVPVTPQDRILIVGVNHVMTGKATYLSHSIVDSENSNGLKGISDGWLAGTGLKMGNVTNPNDPRYATYQQLYAFTTSYDCAGDPVCVTIPQPSGPAVDIAGRIYLDPATKTRPSTNELVLHRVFVLTKK